VHLLQLQLALVVSATHLAQMQPLKVETLYFLALLPQAAVGAVGHFQHTVQQLMAVQAVEQITFTQLQA
jgi:hypothetical protein